jgi:hypothetical protein
MLRPNLGLIYDFGDYRIGLLASKVKFPNGEINSNQIGLSIDIPFTALFSNRLEIAPYDSTIKALYADHEGEFKGHLDFAKEEMLLSYQTYLLQNNSYDATGKALSESMNLMGVEMRHYFINHFYFSLQTAGETGGNRDGYAEIFFGAGYQYPIERLKPLSLTANFTAGSGGGGGLDTGGGALAKIIGGIEYQTGPFKGQLESGLIKSANGNMNALILGLKAGFQMDTLIYKYLAPTLPTDEKVKITGWRVRASHETYVNPKRKSSSNEENVALIGLKGDRILSDSYYITGQAFSAYNGHAGGYSSGLFGPGLESAPIYGRNIQLVAELLVGAGGGGGLSVGGGAIVQPMIGLRYRLMNLIAADMMAGRIKSFGGELDSTVVDFSLVYHFARLERE